ncbi:HlyD family secretion protein [Algoriphagus yeomjeoni]|uniref:Multidrug resistance efflux pump n=1 Tax=Algoriphagus yeomjeoni TaxID=291403 RepID=A0A327PP08_9BACT|nr:HlyD family efflux transporter periplasmic adaptor subunit [Algoriphagus yeomjeoni]RAI93779.1 multidrug resistance efflux pump [Algoriphagus yeomjeoni]
MLNISENKILDRSHFEHTESLKMTVASKQKKRRVRILFVSCCVVFLILFLPWTQYIRSKGYVTMLQPEHRAQTIQSVIAGRIEKWYVNEGVFVSKGDTIVSITEVKDEYFDSLLLPRTQLQVQAKNLSALSYKEKVKALESQIEALKRNNILRKEQARNKLEMAELKVESDSIRFEQAKVNFEIGVKQLGRAEKLYEEGLRSLTDLETRRLKFQEVQASVIGAENSLLSSRNSYISAVLELDAIDNDFRDKLSKAESDMFTAQSSQYDAEGSATKLENQYSNYEARTGFRHILAPQDGFIAEAIQVGLGETIKEGDQIVNIVPSNGKLAVEMFISPVDLPLMEVGKKVRFIFDGWPAIVFTGWPRISNGTFGGVIVAVDQFAGKSNQFRVLVAEDPEEEPWPSVLRVGSGADGIALLNDVPVWYELWRQLNGFPADFYTRKEKEQIAKGQK